MQTKPIKSVEHTVAHKLVWKLCAIWLLGFLKHDALIRSELTFHALALSLDRTTIPACPTNSRQT